MGGYVANIGKAWNNNDVGKSENNDKQGAGQKQRKWN